MHLRFGALVVLLVPWALLGGCNLDDLWNDPDPYDEYPKTPAGYRLKIDDLGSGLDWSAAAARFDQAMVDAAVLMHDQYGYSIEAFLALPFEEEIVFRFVDDVRFDVGGIWARGVLDGRKIKVVYWTHSTIVGQPIATPQDAPPGTPPWTVLPSTLYPGQYSYGLKHDPDIAALLKHELGHAIYGPGFEH